MAQIDDKKSPVQMPDVEQKPNATAGKWLLWFIIIFAIVMVLFFIF